MQTKLGERLSRIDRRPAAVFVKPAGALLADVVQQPLRDMLPDRVAAIKSDRISGLDFHSPVATSAEDAQDVALDFREMSLRQSKPICPCSRILEDHIPVFGRDWRIGSRTGARCFPDHLCGQLFLCFGLGMRQLAGRSVIPELEHKENTSRVHCAGI